ncbi:hypothetical protein J3R82DRAFT_1981, partial [Butyriboletus roseoflavus]
MKSCIQVHNESGGVVNITIGGENSLSVGVMVTVALLLAAVLGCSCTSLWFL